MPVDSPPVPVPKEKIMSSVVSKLTVAVALLVGSTAAFAAGPTADPLSTAVRYSDLNLSTTDGVHALYQRISSAARQVCPDIYSRDLGQALAGQRCQADAVAKAVSRIDNPRLAMLHAAHVSHG